jgi:Fic family protein
LYDVYIGRHSAKDRQNLEDEQAIGVDLATGNHDRQKSASEENTAANLKPWVSRGSAGSASKTGKGTFMSSESPARIEPCALESLPSPLSDAIVELVQSATVLGSRIHPRTGRGLANLVSIMNCYYSNLIEGHHTRPRDIERALADDLDAGPRRDLQVEARAHIRVQQEVDALFREGRLDEPASSDFVRQLHRNFYRGVPRTMLVVKANDGRDFVMIPGDFRTRPDQDVAVGRHQPPSSTEVNRFMDYFASRFQLGPLGAAQKIVAMAAAHHRFNYIHPFPDGNGRVSRLMSHAMALKAGIGAHGLWSISRGLARGLQGVVASSEYKQMMDATDSPRRGDTDGRGNLSEKALVDFVTWFIEVARDQVRFMTSLFEFDRLRGRLHQYVLGPLGLGEEARAVVDEVFLRGEIPRGEAPRITKLPERTAREVLSKVLKAGLLASETPKGDVSLRFSSDSAEFLFPRLFSDADLSAPR